MSRKSDTDDDSVAPGDVNATGGSSIDRRTVLRSGAAGAATLGGLSLAGCIGGGDGGGETEVTIISSPAGFDDQAFNDNALQGLQSAAEDFDLSVNEVETTNQGQYTQ